MEINRAPSWIKKLLFSEKIVVAIFIFNLTILLLYLFKASFVQIDNTTILLMVLLLITPFAAHIKKVRWGDFEAELITKEVEKLKEQAEEFEEIKGTIETPPKASEFGDELRELSRTDPVIALVKLRIEMESKLKRLFVYADAIRPSPGIRVMTQTLATTGKINNSLRNVILSIDRILNRVVHDGYVPTGVDVSSIIDIGIGVMRELDSISYADVIEPSSTEIISNEIRDNYMEALYEVTTVVPLVEKPYMNKRVLNQGQLNQFLDGYDEFAEFLVEIKKI